MSDRPDTTAATKPADNHVLPLRPVAPGDAKTDLTRHLQFSLAQNEAGHHLLAAATVPIGNHGIPAAAPKEVAVPKPVTHPETAAKSTWSSWAWDGVANLGSEAKASVTGLFKSGEKSLPTVHLTSEKVEPAAKPAPSTTQSTFARLAAYTSDETHGAIKSVKGYVNSFESLSTKDKLVFAGTGAAVAFMTLKGNKETAAKEGETLLSGLRKTPLDEIGKVESAAAARTPRLGEVNTPASHNFLSSDLTPKVPPPRIGAPAPSIVADLKFAPTGNVPRPASVFEAHAFDTPKISEFHPVEASKAVVPAHPTAISPIGRTAEESIAPRVAPVVETSHFAAPPRLAELPKPVHLAEPPLVARPVEVQVQEPAARSVEPRRVEEPASTPTRPAEIHLQEPAAPAPRSVEPHRVEAPEAAPSTRPVEVHSPQSAPSTRPFEVHSQEAAPATRPVEVRSLEAAPSTRPVEVRSPEAARPVEVHAPEAASAIRPVEVHAPEAAPAIRPVEVHSPEAAPSTGPVEVHSPEAALATRPVEVRSPEAAPAARPVEVHATEAAPATRPVEVHAPATRPVEVHPPEAAPATRPVEVHAPVAAPAARPVEVHASEAAPATHPVEVHVSEAAPATRPFEVHPPEAAPAARPVEVHVSEAAPAARSVEARRIEQPAPQSINPVEARIAEAPHATESSTLERSSRNSADTSIRGETLRGVQAPQIAAERAVAETQIVNSSNKLAQDVSELKIPKEASKDVIAARTRLQETSLSISQSTDRAAALTQMKSDVQVLEREIPSESLVSVRRNLAEIESGVANVERSVAPRSFAAESAAQSPADKIPVEVPSPSAPKFERIGNPEANPVSTFERPAKAFEPHAVSVQEQSLQLLERGDLPRASRQATSRIIQDTNNWAEKSLSQRAEAISRLEANVKVLSADENLAVESRALAKTVDSLKVGTDAEFTVARATKTIENAAVHTVPQAAENAELQVANARLKTNAHSYLGAENKVRTMQEMQSDLARVEQIAGREAAAPIRQGIANLEKAAGDIEKESSLAPSVSKLSNETPQAVRRGDQSLAPRIEESFKPASRETRGLAEAESPKTHSAELHSTRTEPSELKKSADAVGTQSEISSTVARVRQDSESIQQQALSVLEKGGLQAESRKALVNIVQDSGNVAQSEGLARKTLMSRLEQNLKVVAKDGRLEAEFKGLSTTFERVEASSVKAERLAAYDKQAAEIIPKIGEQTNDLRATARSAEAGSERSLVADKTLSHLDSLDNEVRGLNSSTDKLSSFRRMHSELDQLEELAGKKSLAPLRENVESLEHAHRSVARASRIEESVTRSIESQSALEADSQSLRQTAPLTGEARTALTDVQELAASSQKLSTAEIARLNERVSVVSRELEPTAGARLHGHVHQIQTGHQLQQLDRALASAVEESATVNNQIAIAAEKSSSLAVADLRTASESLKVNGVSEIAPVRTAYEKALPALSKEDAININRSLTRIEERSAEAAILRQQIVRSQEERIAALHSSAQSLVSHLEIRRSQEIAHTVVSSRDSAIEHSLKSAENARNTSDKSVFSSERFMAAKPVQALFSAYERLKNIQEAASAISTVRDALLWGLQRHPVATTLTIGLAPFMSETGRAMAQSPSDLKNSLVAQTDFSPKSQPTSVVQTSYLGAHAQEAGAPTKPAFNGDSSTVVRTTQNAEAPASPIAAAAVAPFQKVSEATSSQPVVRGAVNAEQNALSPTVQAVLKNKAGEVWNRSNGQMMWVGNSFIWAPVQAGVSEAASEKAAIYAPTLAIARSISVSQPQPDERPRIFYPPFINPLSSVSAKTRKPLDLLGINQTSLATSSAFLNNKLNPVNSSLSNPLKEVIQSRIDASEESPGAGNGNAPAVGPTSVFGAPSHVAATITANAVNATTNVDPDADPTIQQVAQSV